MRSQFATGAAVVAERRSLGTGPARAPHKPKLQAASRNETAHVGGGAVGELALSIALRKRARLGGIETNKAHCSSARPDRVAVDDGYLSRADRLGDRPCVYQRRAGNDLRQRGGLDCADEKTPRSMAIQPTAIAKRIATIAKASVEAAIYSIICST